MASLNLSFLGSFQVTREGVTLAGFESNKVRALLIYLAIESGHPHSREELAEFLWPDRAEQVARSNLRQALANLRQTLGDDSAPAPVLQVTRDSVQFNTQADAWLDVSAFNALVSSTERHLHRREDVCHRCAEWNQAAVTVYRGDFLEHFSVNDSPDFEEWLLVTRERLRDLAIKALLRLCVYHERRGQYEKTLHYARRLLELDPWREEAHRQIMRVLAFGGQPSAALKQYETCRRVLDEELEAEPCAETRRLYQQIKTGASPQPFSCKPSRLPVQHTPFIGREREAEEIAGLIEGPDCRLVTLSGPCGIGKTRLALKVAGDQVGSFLDGVVFIPLAPLHPGESLVPVIARSVGLALKSQPDARDQLFQHLSEKEMLLVLDNFEHLLPDDASTGLVAGLLQAAPDVRLVVTSRERLNLRAEQVYTLAGLPFPHDDHSDGIEAFSSVQLFLRQARLLERDFALEGDEARAVAHICRLVEGMPLAIEMAAGGIQAQSCRVIAQAVENGLQALATTLRDVPDRHRSMRAVFDYSWRLLSAREQRCLQRLSVFRGGIEAGAACQVAGADLALLAELAGKSLLRVDPARRYDLHELFRQYALERLSEAGEMDQARNDHLAWFLALAEEAEPELYAGSQQAALDRLEADHANLRAALDWAVERRDADAAARLGAVLSRFWGLRGYLSEGRQRIDKVLALFDDREPGADSSARAKALLGAGALAWRQGDFGPATACMEESLAISKRLGDDAQMVRALRTIATVESSRGNDERAIALLRECLERDRRAGDRTGMAYDYGSLADSMFFQETYEQAKRFYEESLALHRERQDDYSVAICLNNLGEVARVLGDRRLSAGYIREAIALFRKLGIKQSLAMASVNLAELELLLGEDRLAKDLFCEALMLQQALNARGDIASNLPNFAALALNAQEPARAACLYAAAQMLREAAGLSISPAQAAEYEAKVNLLRARLGETAFKGAWEQGNAMTLDEAVRYALKQDGAEQQ